MNDSRGGIGPGGAGGNAYWALRAPAYERSAWVRNHDLMARLLALLPQARPGPCALEVGTGTGVVARAMLERCTRVVGLDRSPAMLRRVDHPAIHRALGDAHRLPFPDAGFPLVVMRNVLHYLDDPGTAFAEIARCLQPGGLYLFSQVIPPADALSGEYDHLIGRRIHYPTRGEIERLFASFAVEESTVFALPRQSVNQWLEATCDDPRSRSEIVRRHRDSSAEYKRAVNYLERGGEIFVDINHLIVRAARPGPHAA